MTSGYLNSLPSVSSLTKLNLFQHDLYSSKKDWNSFLTMIPIINTVKLSTVEDTCFLRDNTGRSVGYFQVWVEDYLVHNSTKAKISEFDWRYVISKQSQVTSSHWQPGYFLISAAFRLQRYQPYFRRGPHERSSVQFKVAASIDQFFCGLA